MSSVTVYVSGNAAFRPVLFGNETRLSYISFKKCPDCDVGKGEQHIGGCDVEECPFCHGQIISCDCPIDERTMEV